ELVRVLGRTAKSIRHHRVLLDIRARPPVVQQPWKEWEIKLLGTSSDRAIARRLKRSVASVENKRCQLGIKSPNTHFWTTEEETIIGQVSDAEAARRLGRTKKAIGHRRRALGMAFFHMEKAREWTASEETLLGTNTDA